MTLPRFRLIVALACTCVCAGCSASHGPSSEPTPARAVAGQGGDDERDPEAARAPEPPAQPGAGPSECDAPDAFAPLVARDGETCWSFRTHEVSLPTDVSKFVVPDGESYSQLYYDVPWPTGSLGTRFGFELDNVSVLRHALVFSSSAVQPPDTVSHNVIGTTIGENAELLAMWAPGACATSYPEDVGAKLPDSGRIMVQWHHLNETGRRQLDGSTTQICTVPAGARAHVGGVTFLGTENLGGATGMGAGKHEFSGTCSNDSGTPVTVVGFTPHMRGLGIRMRSVVNKAGGGTETIFDQPFAWDQQVHYLLDSPYVLQPGDSLTAVCTYWNDTGRDVGFGQSAAQETCAELALAYPYGALNNGVPSLIGATNVCWGF